MLASSFSMASTKLDISMGYYDFSASAGSVEVKRANIGTYDVDLRYSYNKDFEFGVGYSILMTDTIGGDMSFGPNLSILYFPLSLPNTVNLNTNHATLFFQEVLRPFISVNFNQRQFESIQSTYAGFGFEVGTEYWIQEQYGIKVSAQSVSLNGPQKSSAQQVDLLVGITSAF
jgi:long-subunit fatty acid transport protein